MLNAWLWERVLAHVEAPSRRLVCAHWDRQLRSKVLDKGRGTAYDLHPPRSAERLLAADRQFLLDFLQSDVRKTHFWTDCLGRWLAWAACCRLGTSAHERMVMLYK